jgi:hypothetical protein
LKQEVSQIVSVPPQYRSIPMLESTVFLGGKWLAVFVDYLLVRHGELVHGSTADFCSTHVQLLSNTG